ncbi:hypothetical protein GUITHDRAFT_120884 [Guillardia theta CCMP2712]|uniref:Uncharacterized protein n=1 Tax=Guillardia theta (strain CCMP2712) TaxID=905079 RepID=L1I9M8_GUITC|nr:hypothetical protein GUITHDRAFT_120884 [Guillardia theta CCMP2712]EKX32933.1 hypothetical protein GUITHDRAFT_120884 [Guillardia theta CCMP2712]|eukprot:XP_005819913.1 hypothetical protein GUITHDRAFT_120884 [Guillardia theta CCMP2712]
MSALLRWLEGGGVQLGGVEAVWREGMGWALRASKRISPGETFLKVPRHLLLGPHQLRASSLDRLLEGWQLPDCMLLLLMCESVNSSSFFRPYLDLLPDTVDTPITWSKEEAKELVGSPVLHRAVKLRHELARSFQEMKDKVFDKYPDRFPPLLFSYERYQWAYSILRSRAFGNYTLMPLIDLMNHHPDSRLAPTLLSDGSDALIARREYNVWGFYGRKSDADLLLNYDLKHMLVQACGFSITQQKFALYKGLISSSLITFLSIDAADDVDGEETLIALAHGDVRTMRVQLPERRSRGRPQALARRRKSDEATTSPHYPHG